MTNQFNRDHGICRICGFLEKTWQADHIVPVAEGGGQCGLDGYRLYKDHKWLTHGEGFNLPIDKDHGIIRTLCRACHARETSALRRRLKAARLERRENP